MSGAAQRRELEELKATLGSLLEGEQTDYESILRLAGEISRHEPDVVRFSTDAAMVRRLGRELVAKQETALSELVKNAYDADAVHCSVTVSLADGGSLEIIDDGTGMTRDDLVNGFMRLASDRKVQDPYSPHYRRPRAGKKGIGRFATERLGQRLTVVTATANEETGWTVTVDWASFAQGMDLNHVANSITSSVKERPHGTRLLIENLSDSWSESELRRVYRYLSTLLQPPPDGAQTDRQQEDPGFALQLVRENDSLVETILNADSEILGQALAVIEASIDDAGHASWSLSCRRLNVEVISQPTGLDRNRPSPLDHARNVRLKAHYFIKSREFLGQSTAFIKSVLDSHGGIRVYRNGYRVPPYGDPDDDWLGLDYKRTFTYAPINTKAFIGFVSLDDPAGVMFEETSSREGLIETEGLREVRDVMSGVLEAAVLRIESARDKGRGRKRVRDAESGQRAAEETEAAAADIAALVESVTSDGAVNASDGERLQHALLRLNDAARASADISRDRDDLLKELNLLRILASMGLIIAEFTHDFSHLAETMELSLRSVKRAAAISAAQLESALERFSGQFSHVRAFTGHFGNMMTSNASRDLQTIDLYDFARRFRDDMKAMFDRRGLELTVERPADYDIHTTKMHPSEWSSIFLNLLTNSMKAAKRAQRSAIILVRVGVGEPGTVFLEFCDNGDGIPVENRDLIFQAFYTTTGGSAARASETAQALGTGLGLKIVADIAQAAGGDASVVDAPSGFSTCIRVTVPAGDPHQPGEEP